MAQTNHPKKLLHRGMDHARTRHNPREEAFAEQWEKENEERHGMNHSLGILQLLMFERKANGGFTGLGKMRQYISNREAAIVATIVQWLGTNVGWCFLEKALARCGYRIVADENWEKKRPTCSVCRGQKWEKSETEMLVCAYCHIGQPKWKL